MTNDEELETSELDIEQQFGRAKCDGNHGGPPCGDPECLNDESEAMKTPLPCDVTVGHTTFRKGVRLGTFVMAARRWHREAFAEFYELSPEQKAQNLRRLQACADEAAAGVPGTDGGQSNGMRAVMFVEVSGEPYRVTLPSDRMCMLLQLAGALFDDGKLNLAPTVLFKFPPANAGVKEEDRC